MRIREIRTSVGSTHGLGKHNFGTNHIDILTGPNGSGKTILLNSILQFFRPNPKNPNHIEYVVFTKDQTNYKDPKKSSPLKIVAQTFSPFSRFPSPDASKESLLESYTTELQTKEYEYICAGIHRGTRQIGPNLSKAILEESIFRLSQSSKHAYALAQALSILNFSSRLIFIYSSTKTLSTLFRAQNRKAAIIEMIKSAHNSTPIGKAPRSALGLEASLSSHPTLASFIDSALDQLQEITSDHKEFKLNFDFNNRHLHDFATLQALALLRKLGLLKLVSCYTGPNQQIGSEISYSSSGQQQLLCSLFSLVSTLSDGAVVLVDEPELSLHPTWQQLYFDILLASIAPFEDCHIIVATHSPLIVQRAQNAKAGIIRMGANTQKVDIRGERSSVEDALLDVFETPITDSVEMASKIFDAITQAEGGTTRDRNLALSEIKRLREIYSKGPTQNQRDLMIIDDAYRMLSGQ